MKFNVLTSDLIVTQNESEKHMTHFNNFKMEEIRNRYGIWLNLCLLDLYGAIKEYISVARTRSACRVILINETDMYFHRKFKDKYI